MLKGSVITRVIGKAVLAAPGGRQALDLYSALKLVKLADLRAELHRPAGGTIGALPLPGLLRRISVAGTPNVDWFLASGAAAASCLRQALAGQGRALEDCRAILDFGAGCGRVLRHLAPLAARARICGVDINPGSIAWAKRNLRFAEMAVCPLAPPLDLDAGSFDLIYALSVFTHLPEDLQLAWMREKHRLLRPGGLLFFTTHGVSYAAELGPEERASFDSGQLVVRRADTAGSNWCGAYHPPLWVAAHLESGFRRLEHRPDGALGNPHQDYYLFAKI